MLIALACLVVQIQPILGTHSHNDYLRSRPLLDALDSGFTSVEVDVFLVDGKLLVGHDRKDLKPERTIESLYLDPLAARVKKGDGWVYPSSQRLWVLVDIKQDGPAVYSAFKKILGSYPALQKGVRFVISGDRPIGDIVKDAGRFAALDGRWSDLDKGYSKDLMPWVSESWNDHVKWLGLGPLPVDMKEHLEAMVRQVHSDGRLLRFWGAPDSEAIWDTQKKAGVDWLNTDRPAELRKWLLRG